MGLDFGVSNEWWLDGLFKNWVDFKMDLDASTYFNVSRLKTRKMSLCVCKICVPRVGVFFLELLYCV